MLQEKTKNEHLMRSMNKRLCEHKMIVFIKGTHHPVVAEHWT
jgi:hypothetical protein